MADLASRITKPDAKATASSSAAAPALVPAPATGAQHDGPADGTGLLESTYDVEVKLSDLQSDEANPLYSVQSFEQLGL